MLLKWSLSSDTLSLLLLLLLVTGNRLSIPGETKKLIPKYSSCYIILIIVSIPGLRLVNPHTTRLQRIPQFNRGEGNTIQGRWKR